MMQPTSSSDVFTPLDRPEQVDQLVERSFTQPVVIFKHSPACGTSAYAFDELEAYRRQPGALDVFIVDVLGSRALAQAIAARFKVHHESPQLLLLVNGQVAWTASHYGVSAAAVQRALGGVRSS